MKMTIEYKITLKVKNASALNDICEYLMKLTKQKSLMIHAIEIQEQPNPIIKETILVPREMWKDPTPIVTKDKSSNTQEAQVFKYFQENPNKAILKAEWKLFAENNRWEFNSVMSAISHLSRTHGIRHLGRGQGYIYEPHN